MQSFYVLQTGHCVMGAWCSRITDAVKYYRDYSPAEPSMRVLRISLDSVQDVTPTQL